MIDLVAVQAEVALERYRSEAAFRSWIFALTEAATAGLHERPTLIAFPEIIGLPLLLALDAAPREVARLPAALGRLWRLNWSSIVRSRSLSLLRRLYAASAVRAYDVYQRVFAAASREFGVTVVAGSIFLPTIDWEPAKGLHITDQRVYNTAFTFAPSGRLLGRSRKAHLTKGIESRIGLSRGAVAALPVMHTPLGRLGVAVCLDAFYTSVIDHFDGQGAQLVVQPSANHAAWLRPWPPDTGLSEGEAWLRYGLRAQLQQRQHLCYGVNPMLVGELWGLVAEGRSSIVANTDYYPVSTEGYSGLVAIAADAVSETVVRATLPAPAALALAAEAR